jgi:hypothetical protein
VDLLRPFVVTAAHSGKEDLSDLEPAVRDIFTKSDLSKDPQRLNVFVFALNHQGEVIHEFHGVPGSGRSAGHGRSDHLVEIQRARTKLKLSEEKPLKADRPLKGLPDLKGGDSGLPAGVRLFIRQDDPSNSHFSQLPVVEVVPVKGDEWKPLSFAPGGKTIEAQALKNWLVWLYPAGIRTADEQKRFQQFSGTLKLEPAGSDKTFRYALLRGKVRLAKGEQTESEFEGEFQAVLSYRSDAAEVRSVRGVIEGTYLYRVRGSSPQKIRAAIESRPE